MTGRGNWRIKDDTGLFNSNLCALYGSMHPPGDCSGCTVGHSVQSCRIFWSHCFCYCLFKLYLWSNGCCSICLCTHLILSGAHVHVIVLAWKFYFHSLVWPAGCWYLVALRTLSHARGCCWQHSLYKCFVRSMLLGQNWKVKFCMNFWCN